MFRFVKNLLGAESKPTKRKSRRQATGRRLGFEGLECRELMAVVGGMSVPEAQWEANAPSAVTVGIQNSDLVINGTNGADDVTVSHMGSGKYQVAVKTIVNGKAVTKLSTWRPTGGDVIFHGNKGDDKFSANGTTLRVTAKGGEGNDVILGSSAVDNLYGGIGNDTLRGGPGKDKLFGEAGTDYLYGGLENDEIDGGANFDYIYGENGDDTIWVGYDYSANYVEGGYGNDTITGGYGPDRIYGNDGNDKLYGGAGNDYLDSGAGDDYLYGGNDHDYLYGGDGLDYLHGDEGDDNLDGGAYEDYDELFGGDGKDRFRRDPSVHGWWEIQKYYVPGPGGNNSIMDLEPGEEVYDNYEG